MAAESPTSNQKVTKNNVLMYVVLAIIALLIVGLLYFVLSKSGKNPINRSASEQTGGGLVPKSLNKEKLSEFATNTQNFNLSQDSYEQAQITLFNSGTVATMGTQNSVEGNKNYVRYIKLQNDEGNELDYRFTQEDIDNMLVIRAQTGGGGGEKVTFYDIAEGDRVNIQNIINLLEEGGDRYIISIMNRETSS